MQMVQRLDVSGSEAIESIADEGLRYSPACRETYKSRPGFYKTERGKRHFNLNLQQITDAVHTTCYFGVIHALLQGQSYYREWHKKFGRQITRQNDLQQMERRRWAIVQKQKNGLYLLDAEIRHEMKREGIVPNIWVFPDKMLIYVNMVGDHQMDYHQRGPEANSNRERGDQKTTFRGCPVFEAQSFDVDFTGQPIDLMVRERQCGEFFVLKKGQTKYIYDADSDNWAPISYTDLEGNAVNATSGAATAYPNVQGKNDVNGEDPAIATDPDLIIFRPHQTYRMASAILAKGGAELGSTFHGHHDFMLSDDIIRKVHVGHFTFYSKSVVKRPKNYVIIEDIFSQGYVGGEGVEPFADAADYQTHLNGGTLGKGGTPSLIVVKTKQNSTDKIANCIDLTGRFHPSVYERFHGDYAKGQQEHYVGSASVYVDLDLQSVDPYRLTEDDEFLNRVQRINTVCFRGCEGVKDAKDQSFKITQLNQGHWGPNVYPGVRRVRDGENSFMKDCDYKLGLK